MTFLNPAILFGLFAASIPVLIHFLNLRKLKRIEFSTLKFIKELQKNRIRKIKLKQLLLLALRVLIILLIVTAFARPTIEGVSIGGTTSAAKTTALFILDDTFSMSVVDQNGSYFNQAKQTIKTLLAQLQEGGEAGIVLVSSPGKEVELTTNLNLFEKDLGDINISYISDELNSAVIAAADIISQSKNFNKEIYLFTDFQKGRLYSEQNLTSVGELLNEQVRLYSFAYQGKDVFNSSIDELLVKTQIFEINKPIKFEVKVTNHSNKQVNNLVVSLFINGKHSAQKSVSLNSGSTQTVQLEAATDVTGYTDAYVEIEEDDVLQDNRKYTNIFIPDKVKVLLLSERPADIKFIKLALQSGSNNFEVTEKQLNQLQSVPLTDFDVILIIGSEIKGGEEKLIKFLNDGKGVMVFPGSEPDAEKYNKLIGIFGLQTRFDFISAENVNQSVEFENVELLHPLFEDIFIDEEKKEIESPSLYKYYRIKTDSKGKNIITLNDESSFLSDYVIGNGKLLLFNSSPVLSWNDFPLKSIFAPLLNKAVYYLSSSAISNSEYLAGENLNVNISQRTLPQIRVLLPEGGENLYNLNDDLGRDFFTFSNTDYSGNYKFYSGEKILADVSVNTDPVESKIEYLSDDEFDEYLEKINFKGTHIKIESDENPLQVILQARFGSELWRYFVLVALIVALIEMAVAKNVKKEIVESTEQ